MKAKSYLRGSAPVQKSSTEPRSAHRGTGGCSQRRPARACVEEARWRHLGGRHVGSTCRASLPGMDEARVSPRRFPARLMRLPWSAFECVVMSSGNKGTRPSPVKVPRGPGTGRVTLAYKSVTKGRADAVARRGFPQPLPLGDGSRVGVGPSEGLKDETAVRRGRTTGHKGEVSLCA